MALLTLFRKERNLHGPKIVGTCWEAIVKTLEREVGG